jgi:transposase
MRPRRLGQRRTSIRGCAWEHGRLCPGRVARRIFPPLARHTVGAVACQGIEEREFGGFSHDSVRDLARLVAGRGARVTLSPATVQRVLAALVLQPHRPRSFWTRTAPLFEEKRAEILELSLHPPRRGRILCRDEKTHIHALERL